MNFCKGLGTAGLGQYYNWLHELIREVLLYNYKVCPNAEAFLRMQGSVSVDPIKRFHEIASPDSLEAICSIYEIYRAIVAGLGEGESLSSLHHLL